MTKSSSKMRTHAYTHRPKSIFPAYYKLTIVSNAILTACCRLVCSAQISKNLVYIIWCFIIVHQRRSVNPHFSHLFFRFNVECQSLKDLDNKSRENRVIKSNSLKTRPLHKITFNPKSKFKSLRIENVLCDIQRTKATRRLTE